MTPKITKSFMAKLIWKTFSAACAILIIGSLLISFIGLISEEGPQSMSDDINMCERNYHDRDFADLYDMLILYDLYSEEFGKYWEVVDAYEAFNLVREWQKAVQMGAPGAEEKLERAKEDLIHIRSNIEYQENAVVIDSFLRRLEDSAG